MKKWISRFSAGMLIFIIFSGVIYSSYIYMKSYHFYAEVVKGVCIKQRIENDKNRYDFIDCSSNTILVKSVFDWVIDKEFIYGSTNKNEGFVIMLESMRVMKWNSLDDLDFFINDNSLLEYNLNNSLNIADLKFK